MGAIQSRYAIVTVAVLLAGLRIARNGAVRSKHNGMQLQIPTKTIKNLSLGYAGIYRVGLTIY